MKNKIFKLIAQQFLVIIVMLILFVAGTLTVFFLLRIWNAEQINFLQQLNYFRFIYHRLYLLRALLPFIVLLAGAAWLLKLAFKLLRSKNLLMPGAALMMAYVVITGIILTAEIYMRSLGERPGVFFGNFKTVDTLIATDEHLADERGMNYQNKSYIRPDSTQLVNKQGFFSPFDYDTETLDSLRRAGKKIVFIIGNSFVAGMTSTTWDKTFCEILKRRETDFAICTFGVEGADPLNDYLIAEKFMPLKPDIVIEAFTSGTDMMQYDRIPTPGIPLWWSTNAGLMCSNIPMSMAGQSNIILRSPKEAYDYYTASLNGNNSLVARYCRHLCVTTQLYRILQGKSKSSLDDPDEINPGVTYRYLHQIDSLCNRFSSRFEIAFIPRPNQVDKISSEDEYEQHYQHIFKDLLPKTHFILTMHRKQDFLGGNDNHFSDSGNEKYAVFLDSLIREP